jgi:branched-chain amino acid transport system substrate-binding protein
MKIKKANPDILISTVGGANYIPLLRQMEKFQLETLDLLVVDFVNEGDLVKGIKQLIIGSGDNVIWLSRYASALDLKRPPEFENIQKAMNKYSHRYPLSALHAMGWTMGRVVESALEKAGWPCTRGSFITALEKTDLDTNGLTGGPIRFSPTDHYGPSWWKAYRWDGKTMTLKTMVDWYKLELQDIMGKF